MLRAPSIFSSSSFSFLISNRLLLPVRGARQTGYMHQTLLPWKLRVPTRTRNGWFVSIWLAVCIAAGAEPQIKTENFDHDPNWEGLNNHIVPKELKSVTQDFGYSPTSHASTVPGEIGGLITRASDPAYYAENIGGKTLEDKLSASGTFAVTKTTSGAGVFFGFFRAQQPGAGGRPVSSLGLDFDFEPKGGRLALRLITGKNQSCGTFITPFVPGKFRPTPIHNDGTRYKWTLDYDPSAANGRGQIKFTIHSDAHKPGELEKPDMPENFKQEAHRRFPSTTEFTVDLPDGFKKQNATFDHFGLMNMMKAGRSAAIYFADLKCNGRAEDLSHDPNWDASGNRTSYKTTLVGGAHDFGFTNSANAGGKAGEVGGTFWRTAPYAYYADRIGPLTLGDHIEASGNVVLKVGAPDSDMFIGFFNGANKTSEPAESGNFLGIHVGGPTRVGHYFQPSMTTSNGSKQQQKTGPVLEPGKTYKWSLSYDPTAQNGLGAIRVTLGDESTTLPLRKGAKTQGATFDRFGLFNSSIGGQVVKIYLDDLKYTASAH